MTLRAPTDRPGGENTSGEETELEKLGDGLVLGQLG